MDAKLLLLDETLNREFDMVRYVRFIKEFFNKSEILSPNRENEKVWSEYKYYIKSYTQVARYKDDSNNNILILAIKLQKGRAIDKARSTQRNFISKLISNTNYDAALVAFYSENEPTWRLSFVKLDVEFVSGKLKTTLTPAKRYSYLVGKGEPTHTAQERIFPIFRVENFNPTLNAIQEAFSVEAVTKIFFEKYKEKYLQLKEHLDSNERFNEEAKRCQFTSEQFAKKLMGQLAFLYFLQKKGWLGVKVAPHELSEKEYKDIYYSQPRQNREIFEKMYIQHSSGVYRLQNVTTLDDSSADVFAGCFKNSSFEKENGWGSGTKTFIKDIFDHCNDKTKKNFFDDFLEPLFYDALNKRRGENHYYKEFNCKIPFLNGGLFDPLENYNWKSSKFEISNELFSNEKIKGKDEADGILDIFNRYNFTINEDEPLEKEVAVDPEMLGKIFENLLDVKDRKSKGAFYTPREIVHYMCQESLINYLVNKVGVPYDDIKDFVLYGELMKDEDCSTNSKQEGYERKIPKSVFEKLYQIDKALENVKVADPAVGSGAFPLGMLNEIVKIRMNITEYFVQLIDDNKKFERLMLRKSRHPYKIKWETIKNCIFAVDIENSAVDIAKLRLWLSIVVEQEIDEENPYPHALPNLDCNIMCGNSLIDEFEGIKLFDENLLREDMSNSSKEGITLQMSLFQDQVQVLIDELFIEQSKLFGEDDTAKKLAIKRRIDSVIDSLIRLKLSRENNSEGLRKYEESLKNKTKPYFLWYLEFGKIFKENGGFDIVIGNPPYVDSENMVRNMPEFRATCTRIFQSAKGNWDLYILFVELGYKLLCNKGNVSFIIPNKIIAAEYANEIRNIMSEKYISEIRDYSNVEVFKEADVYPVTFISNSVETHKFVRMCVMESLTDVAWQNDIENDYFNRTKKWDSFFAKNIKVISIIEKMLQHTRLEGVADVKGAATVSEAYVIKEHLVDEANYEGTNHFKFINTGTIDQFQSLWGIEKTQYIKGKYQHPIISRSSLGHLYPKRLRDSQSAKIIIGGMTKVLECFYDEGEYLAGKSTTLVLDSKESLKYIIGILNSNLMSKFYKIYFNSLSLAGGYLRIGAPQIKQIPIAIGSESEKFRLIKLVEYLIENPCDLLAKSDLDKIVYSIYGLSENEIRIIEEV